jgi:RNA polymerase sigma-70 factor (ECF subfamily)
MCSSVLVVVLRHYEGLKFYEIADVLGIPEGTVKSRMFEALDRLAIILKRLGGAPAAHS